MNKGYKYIFGMLATLFAVSCSTDPAGESGGTAPIVLEGTVDTRATGEAVPFTLYALYDSYKAWDGLVIPGASAVLEGTSVKITSNEYFWPQDGEEIRVVGLMNYGDDSSPSFGTNTGYLTLVAGEGHTHNYLLSNNLIVKAGNTGGRRMDFRHLMSRLIVRLDVGDDFTGMHEVELEMVAGKQQGTLSALTASETKTVDSTTGGDHVISLAVQADNTGYTEAVYYLVPDASGINAISKLTVDGGVVGEDMAITVPSGQKGIILESGESYLLTVKINQPDVASVTVTPHEWTEDDMGDLIADKDGGGTAPDIDLSLSSDFFNDITRIVFTDATAAVYDLTVTSGEVTVKKMPELPVTSVKVYDGQTEYELPDHGYIYISSGSMTINNGNGSPNSPVMIKDRAGLEAVSAGSSLHYCQISDLQLGWTDWTPLPAFSGAYDGRGYSIAGLVVNAAGNDAGLFSTISGSLSRLTLTSGSVSGTNNVGAFCGNLTGGTLEECVSHIPVTGNANVGGIIGNCSGATITACKNYGRITFNANNSGGITGQANSTTVIYGCVNKGDVKVADGLLSGRETGGIAGKLNNNSSVSRCYNSGEIYAGPVNTTGSNGNNAGGIAGTMENSSTVSESANDGTVSGRLTVGGIAGSVLTASVVRSCYATGNVNGHSNSGGVVGNSQNATVTACYYKNGTVTALDATESNQVGGVIGYNNTGSFAHALYIVNANVVGRQDATYIGGVFGRQRNSATGCYRESDVRADMDPSWSAVFSAEAWPDTSMTGWELYSQGGYWMSLGAWNGNPSSAVYPKLGWEDELVKD